MMAGAALLSTLFACSGAGPDGPIAGSGQAQSAACATASFVCASSPAMPDVGPRRRWHRGRSHVISVPDLANHRGRDAIVIDGHEQWIIGKLAYGLADKDLKGEEVDLFVERGCGGAWEKLATVQTTHEEAHATVEGVEDSGGRVYYRIPKEKELAVGRHRVRMVVAGDHTFTDLFIEVIAKDAPVFVSDVDGTLTSSEAVEYRKLLEGTLPDPQADAVAVLSALASKGYRPIYLTARPEWLTGRTHAFLGKHGFPPGTVHTSTSLTGLLGDDAANFKALELARLRSVGLDIRWAFGNKESDTFAYESAGLFRDARCIFLRLDSPKGGRRIEAYRELIPEVTAETPYCDARP
jgi:hypothetical protein